MMKMRSAASCHWLNIGYTVYEYVCMRMMQRYFSSSSLLDFLAYKKSESKSNLVMQTIWNICWYKDKESRIGKDRPSEEGWRPVMSQLTDLPNTLIFKQGPLCLKMITLWLSCEIHKKNLNNCPSTLQRL